MDAYEIFKQNMASAHLMTERRTKKGDVVAVVGSSPPLGAWDPALGVVATEFPLRSGHWSATVFYDAGSMQEWNWVIISSGKKELKLAEKCKTRFLHATHGWLKVNAPWNKKGAVVDWSPKEYCGGDDPEPGTVELLKIRKERLREIRQWEEMAEVLRSTNGRVERPPEVTATLQLSAGLTPRGPPRPRGSPSPVETGGAAIGLERPAVKLTPSVETDFQPVLRIKPFTEKDFQTKPWSATPPSEKYPPAYAPAVSKPVHDAARGSATPPSEKYPSAYAPAVSKPVHDAARGSATPPSEKYPSAYAPAVPKPIHDAARGTAREDGPSAPPVVQFAAESKPQSPPKPVKTVQAPSAPIAPSEKRPEAVPEPAEKKPPSYPQEAPRTMHVRVTTKREKHDMSVSTDVSTKSTDATQTKEAGLAVRRKTEIQTKAPTRPQDSSDIQASIMAGRKAASEALKQRSYPAAVAVMSSTQEAKSTSMKSPIITSSSAAATVQAAPGSAIPMARSPSTVSTAASVKSADSRGSIRSVGQLSRRGSGPVDLSKAGYTPDPESPVKGKDGRRNLVSDPGRPGYAMPDQQPEGAPGLSGPMSDLDYGPTPDSTSLSLDRTSSTTSTTSRVSPPVRTMKREGQREKRATVAIAEAGSSTSLGSNVGILGAVCDQEKKHPSLEDLRQLSEQREQARTAERMKELRNREERNKTRIEQSKELEFAASAPQESKKKAAAEQKTTGQTGQKTVTRERK